MSEANEGPKDNEVVFSPAETMIELCRMVLKAEKMGKSPEMNEKELRVWADKLAGLENYLLDGKVELNPAQARETLLGMERGVIVGIGYPRLALFP